MAWIRENTLSWFPNLCVKVVKSGHIPKHVGFIMDGNRRFAAKNSVKNVEGHEKGFDKLAETLKWCLDLGIPEVTVYAFSIENFKRCREEVDGLMELAKQKFQRLLEEKDKLEEYGVRVRVMGNLDLLTSDVRQLIAEAVLITKDHNKAFLNVAFAYTAREEMARSVGEIASGVTAGYLQTDDVTERLVSSCLYCNHSPDPDLLIRTSGEVRMSDFLLWQSSYTCVYFTPILWPEFDIWSLLRAILYYQRCYNQLTELRSKCSQYENSLAPESDRVHLFLERLDSKRNHYMERCIHVS